MEWVGDFGWPPCVKSKVLTFGRATRPTRIESFFVVCRGEDCQVASSGSQLLSLRDRCGEKGAPLGPHAWISLRVFSSQQQPDVVCTVKPRGPCCTNFMRGQQKQKRVFAQSSVKNCGCVKNNATHVPFAARSRLLAPWPTWPPVPSVTRFLPQRDTLPPRCLSWRQCSCLRFAGLGTDDNIVCSVVCNSFRPLVVESGGEPEANLWHRILARRCHRSIGDQFVAREGEPSTTVVATSATSSTLVSFTEPAFFGLLLLRVYGGAQCVLVHQGAARLDSCFRCCNHCTVSSRS